MRSGASHFFAFLFVTALALGASASQDEKDKSATHSRFEQFKKLAGDWVPTDPKPGNSLLIRYKVVSNGSAVVETIGPDTPMEMVTIIHKDGDDIELTHYCGIGNQPHMKAPDKAAGNAVEFKFTHASNMKSDKDMHMHNVTYTFVDKNNLKTEWTNYNDGKPAGNMVFTMKRKQ
jgi:hypothetical protein